MTQEPLALLIDARNLLYRSIFASKADTRYNAANGTSGHYAKYHHFTMFLRQIVKCMNANRPTSVHVFWDAPRKEVWRKKIHATYKERVNASYVEDISEDLFKTTAVAKEFFKNMSVRQYSRKEMEADDLIYATVTMIHPEKTIIVSSDSDMVQIPYNFSSCSVYDPGKNAVMPVPNINPAIQKAIVGDKSDAIDGYYNIGPKKSAALLTESGKLEEFFAMNDRSTYIRNLLLVDLSLCPKLIHNKLYCQKNLQKPVEFNSVEINNLIKKYKVNGLMQEYADLINPFKKLSNIS